MTFNLQAQSGFRRDSMWCGPAEHSVMPSPAERNERGACTFFGAVPLLPPTRVDGYGVARPCQNKGAASLTKAPLAFRKIGEAVNRQGTLTITGSNVRLGTEMPVALSLFYEHRQQLRKQH
jgi:hypothetical protein